jgi:hypothetical protein
LTRFAGSKYAGPEYASRLRELLGKPQALCFAIFDEAGAAIGKLIRDDYAVG